ncbi:hypothetical protein [Sphingobacterium yanglingense]|uniref:Uncharacterized protein n=1 Tax=Sphingobacterium yanglingense TaxID=1437280 RepID=A0A4R6WL56_9SPHI|nr:hypothetical protein [Sphingobacterium yanglingense]TDQ79498.1 hypothetical protein CLV99_0937 [Sphingobacterium yanglingense]
MKLIYTLISTILILLAITSCKKLDEVSPRVETGIIRDYNLPKPTVLTEDERSLVEKERLEYGALTTE